MARLASKKPAGDSISQQPLTFRQSRTEPPSSMKSRGSRAADTDGTDDTDDTDGDCHYPKLHFETPKRRTEKHEGQRATPPTAFKRVDSNDPNDSNALLSSLAGLRLEPSDQEQDPGVARRRSPRKAAPRQRPFWMNSPVANGGQSSSANEEDDDDDDEKDHDTENESALSDFIVDDSASEAELARPPPRPVGKLQGRQHEQPKSRRRLVQKTPAKKLPSVHDESEDEIRVLKPKESAVNLISPSKIQTHATRYFSDKENDTTDSNDLSLSFTGKLDNAIRLSPPGGRDQSASRTHTPPMSPSRPRLQSPTRNRVNIPLSPHRQSIDAFWEQGVVDQWNDVHSPKKTPRPAGRLLPFLLSPKKVNNLAEFDESESDDSGYESPTAKSPKKSPAKSFSKSPSKGAGGRDRAAAEAKKRFEDEKHALAETFLTELDNKITKGELARLSASTGGVTLEWNPKLYTTAGRAKWKCERKRVVSKSGPMPAPSSLSAPEQSASASASGKQQTIITHHHASIELSTKVIDSTPRLLNVLAHEFCHLANFMVSGVKDNPHGASFKAWASNVSTAFADRDIVVTTKHSYEIAFKYVWACTTCATEYKRHSKSIDPAKQVCSACKGALLQIQPAPRGQKGGKIGLAGDAVTGGHSSRGKAGTTAGQMEGRDEIGYNAFVKANFAVVKAELLALRGKQKQRGSEGDGDDKQSTGKAGDIAWGLVMAELAKRWRSLKVKSKNKAIRGSGGGGVGPGGRGSSDSFSGLSESSESSEPLPAGMPPPPATSNVVDVDLGVDIVTEELQELLLDPVSA